MTKNMIFHHPLPVITDGKSGSQVRPYQMAKAFESIGYNVEMVNGYGAERKRSIKKIKDEVKKGRKFDFIYSESSTMPTLLTEPHHFPLYPFLDFGFFRWAKRRNIPIGLFYRDIYWKFDIYRKELIWWKGLITVPLYWYDWISYINLIDHLYLPSLFMKKELPTSWSNDKLSPLPPGGVNKKINRDYSVSDKLSLIYIGGVTPPEYNLIPMFKLISLLRKEKINLKLCCRENEWQAVKFLYEPLSSPNVEMVHLSGSKLHVLYEKADIFLLLREKHEYLDFAMPVKVFESLGNGTPLLTLAGTEAARFIAQEDIGWVVNAVEEAKELLLYLLQNPSEIKEKKHKVLEARSRHTWDARAHKVVQTLMRGEQT